MGQTFHLLFSAVSISFRTLSLFRPSLAVPFFSSSLFMPPLGAPRILMPDFPEVLPVFTFFAGLRTGLRLVYLTLLRPGLGPIHFLRLRSGLRLYGSGGLLRLRSGFHIRNPPILPAFPMFLFFPFFPVPLNLAGGNTLALPGITLPAMIPIIISPPRGNRCVERRPSFIVSPASVIIA